MNDFVDILFIPPSMPASRRVRCMSIVVGRILAVPVTLGTMVVCAKGLLKVDFAILVSYSDMSIDVLLPAII